MFDISFKELLQMEISSASGIQETVTEAPATIIIIDQEKIADLGYQNLLQVLSDLPEMDIIISQGDTPFANYWRGYRNDIGAPYILMIDGVNFNHLYYNFTSVLVTLPITNINHIEVIYGPASSVFGANAFMGIVNIITQSGLENNGATIHSHITVGSHETEILDFHTMHQTDNFTLSASGRLESRNNMPDTHNDYEWTRSEYLENQRLWGDFGENSELRQARSLSEHKALDLRAMYGNTELALQYFQMISGTSMIYPFDRNLPNTKWHEVDKSVYLRHRIQITPDFFSKIMIRYRQSDVPNKTFSVSRYTEYDDEGNFKSAPTLEYWQLLNSSWEFEQNFNYTFNQNLEFYGGINYELKDLQKAYDYISGPYILTNSMNYSDYVPPSPPSDALQYINRFNIKDKGIYLQSKYRFAKHHIFHIGIRYDHNSSYGYFTTIRSGYHLKFDNTNFKLLYGEGFNEPNARVLYGGWAGTGSDINLKPEESKTIESSIDYQYGPFYQLLSLYRIFNRNTILNYQGGARNAGERDVYGLEFHFKYEPRIMHRLNLNFWFYYSNINATGFEKYNPAIDTYSKCEIGDIADHKIHFGTTTHFTKNNTVSLTGRYIGKRKTVYSNPVAHVNDYLVMDLNFRINNLFYNGLLLGFRINNLFDTHYFHPGMRDANAGISPGYFDDDSQWNGSQGWYNSLLPQMGREFFIQLSIETETMEKLN